MGNIYEHWQCIDCTNAFVAKGFSIRHMRVLEMLNEAWRLTCGPSHATFLFLQKIGHAGLCSTQGQNIAPQLQRSSIDSFGKYTSIDPFKFPAAGQYGAQLH